MLILISNISAADDTDGDNNDNDNDNGNDNDKDVINLTIGVCLTSAWLKGLHVRQC